MNKQELIARAKTLGLDLNPYFYNFLDHIESETEVQEDKRCFFIKGSEKQLRFFKESKKITTAKNKIEYHGI